MPDFARCALSAGLLCGSAAAVAETNGVYHPYVNEREREIEYGLVRRGTGSTALTLQRASFGYGWSDRFATELYLLNEFASHGGVRARAYEFEARWQLTEQGEYASDWGALMEAEVGQGIDRHEIAAGLLWEKELGRRWVATANALVEYEFGSDIDNEFETAVRAQLRYLHSPAFEPALEFHFDDIDHAAGPALSGALRFAPGRQLRWEAGIYFGLDRETPSSSARVGLELEF